MVLVPDSNLPNVVLLVHSSHSCNPVSLSGYTTFWTDIRAHTSSPLIFIAAVTKYFRYNYKFNILKIPTVEKHSPALPHPLTHKTIQTS